MFDTITDKISELLEAYPCDTEQEGRTLARETTIYLYHIPIWKLCGFYLYSLTFIRDRDQGRTYRICLKTVLIPYLLHYKYWEHRIKQWFTR